MLQEGVRPDSNRRRLPARAGDSPSAKRQDRGTQISGACCRDGSGTEIVRRGTSDSTDFLGSTGTSSVLSRDGRASAASSCSTNPRAYIDPTSTTLTAELMCIIALRQGLDARGEKGNHGLAGRLEIIGVELTA